MNTLILISACFFQSTSEYFNSTPVIDTAAVRRTNGEMEELERIGNSEKVQTAKMWSICAEESPISTQQMPLRRILEKTTNSRQKTSEETEKSPKKESPFKSEKLVEKSPKVQTSPISQKSPKVQISPILCNKKNKSFMSENDSKNDLETSLRPAEESFERSFVFSPKGMQTSEESPILTQKMPKRRISDKKSKNRKAEAENKEEESEESPMKSPEPIEKTRPRYSSISFNEKFSGNDSKNDSEKFSANDSRYDSEISLRSAEEENLDRSLVVGPSGVAISEGFSADLTNTSAADLTLKLDDHSEFIGDEKFVHQLRGDCRQFMYSAQITGDMLVTDFNEKFSIPVHSSFIQIRCPGIWGKVRLSKISLKNLAMHG